MSKLEIRRNELTDPALAGLFERELAQVGAEMGHDAEPVACVILDEGLHAEIVVELPAWTESVHIGYPVRDGDVRRGVLRVLRESGMTEPPALRIASTPRF